MKQIFRNFHIVKFMLFAIFILALCGCKDDDIETTPNGGELVNKTVEEINSNLRALQKLVTAQDADKAVKVCTQISNSTYKVELEDGNSFNVLTFVTTIGNTEGPVYSPVISTLKSGNTYFWTLDGDFLTIADQKLEVIGEETPVIGIDSDNYWTVTYGTNAQRLNRKVENGTVKSLFDEVILTKDKEVKFSLRGDTPFLTLSRVFGGGVDPIEPTGVLRRPISPENPAWFIHIDSWNTPDPQAIIDLIPDDIRPYVVFNISLSISRGDNGDFNNVAYGYETAKSWLRTCAENNVWAMVQGASGGICHWPDYQSYSQFQGSLFEEFYRDYPNFIGFNYAEQGWGFGSNSATYDERLQHFAGLMQLSNEYGGYLTVSFLNPSGAASNSGVAMIKRSSNFADACKKYPENFISCEKYTQTYGFFDMESTSLGLFVSGFAGNYGMRFDQCGWYSDKAKGEMGWNNDSDFPVATGAIPIIEHTMFTGQTVFDGPELIWQQSFKEVGTSSAGDGFTKRNWETFKQFDNINVDIYRKIIDGTIRILSRKEVIDRTKFVVVNDINPTGSNYDPGYSAPATLFKGLYLMDEDGIQTDHHLYFKKTGRYPAIPTVAELADDLANSFIYKIEASQFNSGTGWGDIKIKQNKFNTVFPEEYTSNGMYAGRHENAWVAYNCYADTKTASIPFKYNTCEKMELSFGKYSVAAIKEHANKVDFYLTNYTENAAQTTDVIKIYGSSSKPSYTYTNRVSGNSCSVSEEWKDNVLSLTIKHNGAVDISVNCSGTATGRETSYTHAQVSTPLNPDMYEGPRQYEAEYFEYKNVAEVLKNAIKNTGSLKNYTALGYLNFGNSSDASVRDQISVNTDGTYTIKIKYNAPTATVNTVDLYINGSKVTTPEFAQTASSDDPWQTVAVSVSLNKGKNVMEFKANASAVGELYFDNIIVESISITN
ncbi:glycoside hydrolase family 98 domain-containing protein [Bacteroides sp. 51]|uniref:glycoside hydrolase family 98 domain-containing protein n=1 Tax=Bacteroides sp. 51 TaxID=2302938 RepID=UPI0013D02855|nr:glycoside hydrolase family 98 domain-containing protein [Bacteroides sp. 51]NDV81619.1 glycosyl hydrolase family 98 [Bacteroides sp. 51]